MNNDFDGVGQTAINLANNLKNKSRGENKFVAL